MFKDERKVCLNGRLKLKQTLEQLQVTEDTLKTHTRIRKRE